MRDAVMGGNAEWKSRNMFLKLGTQTKSIHEDIAAGKPMMNK